MGLRRVLLFSSCRCVSKEVTCQTPVWTFRRFPETLLGLGGAVEGEQTVVSPDAHMGGRGSCSPVYRESS